MRGRAVRGVGMEDQMDYFLCLLIIPTLIAIVIVLVAAIADMERK